MEGDLQQIFGRNLRRYREQHGLSQEAFADLMGVHRTYMGGVERGERNLTYQRLRHYEQAADCQQQTLALSSEIGDRSNVLVALGNLGVVCQRLGRTEQAADYHGQALVLSREIRDWSGEARALNGCGEALRATGRHDLARTRHAAALMLAKQIGNRYEMARAYHGLAHVYYANEEHDQARSHWHEALTLYADALEVEDVRASLAILDREEGGTRSYNDNDRF
jgi:transcriptional regulator with XRE-family HTH domain